MSVTVEFDICSRPDYDIEPDELMERYESWETHLIPKGWEITDEMINHVGVDSSYDIDLDDHQDYDRCVDYGEDMVFNDLDYKLWLDISEYHFNTDTDYKYLPKYYLDGDEYKETTDEQMLEWLGLGITDDGRKLNTLMERIVMLEGKVEDLQSNYNRLGDTVTELEGEIDGVEYRKEELEKMVYGMIQDKETKETLDYLNKKEEKTSE